ncbi:glycosyltransferase family 90 protein [Gonapodya prolifera JEL478]|uniref:Glycosyltransferase family 90 protein n=1 Tax=Gonapodya prolifera (strain JEL478) TaxID=1344416 RepID=A0A139A727_GONPJ|nr:glycosyltransferase family 90 protein [Gonapodya prolifera JEL478]|eukprot:KXS12581.1 glycosyltransferase family 90 protein [Gonapodya prolifera JEL478]
MLRLRGVHKLAIAVLAIAGLIALSIANGRLVDLWSESSRYSPPSKSRTQENEANWYWTTDPAFKLPADPLPFSPRPNQPQPPPIPAPAPPPPAPVAQVPIQLEPKPPPSPPPAEPHPPPPNIPAQPVTPPSPPSDVPHYVLDIKHVPYVHENFSMPNRTSLRTPSFDEAKAYYTYVTGRPPPRLYKPFYDFSVEQKCNVLSMAHLHTYFENLPQNFTPAMFDQAARMERTIEVIVGPKPADDDGVEERDDCWCDTEGNPLSHPEYIVQDGRAMGEEEIHWANLMKPFAKWFPKNFRIVTNELDWPRIKVAGKECVFKDDIPPEYLTYTGPDTPQLRKMPPIPSNSTANLTNLLPLDLSNPFNLSVPPSMFPYHGFFYEPSEQHWEPSGAVLPVFSPTIVPGCHLDIPFPTWYAAHSAVDLVGPDLTPQGADIPFRNKTPVAMWRGSSHGGVSHDDPKTWNRHHRLRLAMLSNDLHKQTCPPGVPLWNASCEPLVDAHLTMYMHAGGPLGKVFGPAGHTVFVPYWKQFGYKYLIDVDGNSFSERLHTFFRESKSLVMRARAFVDWMDLWAVPYVHYIPLKLDWSDLLSAVRWAVDNPDEAEKIAQRGRELGRNGLRWADAHCQMFALMMEVDERMVGRGKLPKRGKPAAKT